MGKEVDKSSILMVCQERGARRIKTPVARLLTVRKLANSTYHANEHDFLSLPGGAAGLVARSVFTRVT